LEQQNFVSKIVAPQTCFAQELSRYQTSLCLIDGSINNFICTSIVNSILESSKVDKQDMEVEDIQNLRNKHYHYCERNSNERDKFSFKHGQNVYVFCDEVYGRTQQCASKGASVDKCNFVSESMASIQQNKVANNEYNAFFNELTNIYKPRANILWEMPKVCIANSKNGIKATSKGFLTVTFGGVIILSAFRIHHYGQTSSNQSIISGKANLPNSVHSELRHLIHIRPFLSRSSIQSKGRSKQLCKGSDQATFKHKNALISRIVLSIYVGKRTHERCEITITTICNARGRDFCIRIVPHIQEKEINRICKIYTPLILGGSTVFLGWSRRGLTKKNFALVSIPLYKILILFQEAVEYRRRISIPKELLAA
jgi:hypothetical protein